MPPRRRQNGDDVQSALDGFERRLTTAHETPNINHYQPMPKQDLFHRDLTKNRILLGGNRSGKTYSGCADDVMVLLRNHPFRNHLYADRPRRIRVIGTDFDRHIGDAILPLFQQLLPPSSLIDGSWEVSYRKSEHKLFLADGSWCSFMSYEQSPGVFQSVSLDHVHFDEEPPQAIFKESEMRVLDTGGTWSITETPVTQMEWLQDGLIEPADDGTRTDVSVHRVSTLDNTHLPVDELARMQGTMNAAERKIRIEGGYTNDRLVFPAFERQAPYVIQLAEFVAHFRRDPSFWSDYDGVPTITASMDYGLANPTAWLWHAAGCDGSIVTFAGLYQSNVVIKDWIIRVKAAERAIARLLSLPANWAPAVRIGDPAISKRENGQTGLSNQQAYSLGGIHINTQGITAARANDYNVGLDKMRSYQQMRRGGVSPVTGLPGPWWQIAHSEAADWERLVEPLLWSEMEQCMGTTAIIDEIRRARRPKQTLIQQEQKNIAEQIRDKDNHAIDAAKYYMMLKHDLRPNTDAAPDTSRDALAAVMQQNFGFTPPPIDDHHGAFAGTMSKTQWSTLGTENMES